MLMQAKLLLKKDGASKSAIGYQLAAKSKGIWKQTECKR